MAKDLPEKANQLVEIAYRNSDRLILLINDILDIDKIASGQMRFEIGIESVSDLVRQAIESNRAYCEKFGVSLPDAVVDDSLNVAVDASRFLQVMSNLISNAAKFSHKGDKVEVTVTISTSNVRISVQDHGQGIPEEFRSRIFGKFSQADASVTRTKGGSGLGLHITKQITEQMGGTIGFESMVGSGSNFWVEFPIAAKA